MDNLKKSIYKLVDKSFEEVYKMDELKRKLVANLQNYLRERMDFIASLPTMNPLWTAQFDIIDNLINPILDDIRDENLNPLYKCPNLFLLFDGILRSEGIRAGGIEFEIKIFKSNSTILDYTWTSKFKLDNQIKYEINKKGNETEFPIAISLGTSGVQAFYGILENIIRNSGRHSNKDEIKKVVEYSDAIKEKKKLSDNLHPLKITIEFYYNWGDNFKENKDDFIRVRIYDNMGGWIENGSNNWVKKENKNFSLDQLEYILKPEVKKFGNVERDGRIINESGNIVQGSWGMKEMRICASFLRGFKISDYETQHEPPVITAVAVPNENNKDEASLGFEFYIPKVKNLLIVSKNLGSNINEEDLKNNGIYIEEDASKIIDLQNRGVFTHEFVAIDIDDEENRKFIQEKSLLLPYKLFFITQNPDKFYFSFFKNIRYDFYLNVKNLKYKKENLKNLIISKDELQKWLTQKIGASFNINNVEYQNCPPAERVYLEVYKRWILYLYSNKETYLPKMGLCYSELGTNLKNLLIDFLNSSEVGKINEKLILLWHRFENYKPVFQKLKSILICASPYAHGISSKATKIAVHFESATYYQDKFAIINYLSTLEMGLANIIIIDERVFDEAKNRRNICGISDINFALSWYLQNVVIFNLDKGTDDKPFKLTCYKIDPERELNQTLDKPCEIIFGNSNSKDKIPRYLSQHLPEHFKNKVHFMIVHQNIISPKIGGKEKFEEFIKSLPDEYKPWYVIITSGRGHPPKGEIPERIKFLDFSTLRSVVIDYPDKFLLTKVLTALKEKEKGK